MVNLIGDLGVLNEDVNIMTMTDFALCKFRREYEMHMRTKREQWDMSCKGGYNMYLFTIDLIDMKSWIREKESKMAK